MAPPRSATAEALVATHPLPKVPAPEPNALARELAPLALSAALLRDQKR